MGVRITSKGIRLDSLNASWSIVSEAPKWDAVVFSKADKTICWVPYATWSKVGFTVIDAGDDLEVTPTAPSVQAAAMPIGGYKSLPVNVVRWQGPAPALGGFMFQSKAQPTMCEFTFVTSRAIQAPLQVAQLLNQFYRLPRVGGIPIRLSVSSEQRAMMETLAIKSTQLSSAIFDLPTNYKRVKTEQQVLVNAKDRQKITDFGQLLGAPEK